MVPVLKKLKVLTLLNLLPLLSYGASFDQLMTIKTFSEMIYISCVHRDTYLYVKTSIFLEAYLVIFMTIFAVSLGSSAFIVL